MEFKSVEFMTKEDKQKVYKQFKTFLNSLIKGEFKKEYTDRHGNTLNLSFKHFTDRIYKHLSLHSGFIAHYNILGFYNTYFNDLNGLKFFISHFLKEDLSYNYCNYEPFKDINRALADLLKENLKNLIAVYSEDRKITLQIQKQLIENELKSL